MTAPLQKATEALHHHKSGAAWDDCPICPGEARIVAESLLDDPEVRSLLRDAIFNWVDTMEHAEGARDEVIAALRSYWLGR